MSVKRNQLLTIGLIAGFLIGVICGVKFGGRELINETVLENLLKQQINTKDYFLYLLKERFLLVVVICFLGAIKWKKAYAVILVGIIGIAIGNLLGNSVLQVGVKGVIFVVVSLVPHGFFYTLAFLVLVLNWYAHAITKWNWKKVLFVICMLVIGVVLEAYWGPFIIKYVTNFLF